MNLRRVAATLACIGILACGDDSSASGGGGAGGAQGGAAQGGAAQGGAASGGAAQGGAASGGAAQGGAAQGGAGGGSGCPTIPFVDPLPAECMAVGALALPESDVTDCTADSSVYWPARVFALEVAAGDCVHMRADNVGSPAGADLFGAIVEPTGKSLLFDEEVACSVPNPSGYQCPDGGVTTEAAGTLYVIVGAWEGQGCPPDTTTPYTLSVSVNGADVALDPAVCSGDLLQIIP